DQVLYMLEAHSNSAIVPLSKSTPDVEAPSLKPLWRALSRVVQHNLQTVLGYALLAGQRVLREQIARLMLDSGSVVTADDIMITSGWPNEMWLALMAVCKPGDIVAVESPCYYGSMQMLRGMGVKVIEIPTDPETGISVEALELALEQWPIKGIILVPNCNNPLGFIMPDARKRAVLSLAQRHDIVIFEDDVYGELATEYPRPRTIHSWDIDGRVLLCSSFSKSIAPGLRVGWVAPGRYHDKLLHMKYAISSFNVPSTQMAAATFVLEGHYHRHIRRMRQTYQRNLALYTCWIREYFPCEICITRPKGGFLLWVELPEQVDMVCVARPLCRMNIQVAAGSIFSASGKYRNCLRIN
ncbi:PLP-dependent aminotransferase family protein, partial [Escherichia coli]|uniref:aminotransferase-like domain-containing protein n=1 Tax=Escherichia coli TaxID=562 RepID=UPI001925D674